MRRRTLFGAGCGLLLAGRAWTQTATEVDLLLVLAADVSQSMQDRDLRLQRRGYAEALRDAEVQGAIASGANAAIGLLYMEWSGVEDQRVLLPWTRIGDAEAAEGFASGLLEAPIRSGTWTSISGALAAARRQMAAAPFTAPRRVVDVSGDGENNAGTPVEEERDAAVAEGIVINGLPILRFDARRSGAAPNGETALEEHYRRMVTGGPGAFTVRAQGLENFSEAIRRKLIMEIAGLSPSASDA
ncbi:DUF1194 domain-containing protein [Falsiroseomonas sp. HW251]|uniref:DUF1194 domain-containing protein n=1 Tax=Falsiroseomonas sp. HW251 TaxID=3390998 RepID=UPI003D311BF4